MRKRKIYIIFGKRIECRKGMARTGGPDTPLNSNQRFDYDFYVYYQHHRDVFAFFLLSLMA